MFHPERKTIRLRIKRTWIIIQKYQTKIQNPNENQLTELRDQLKLAYNQYSKTIKLASNNLNKEENATLKQLMNDKHIVIRKSDKGNTFAVIDAQQYYNAGETFLSMNAFQQVETDDNEKQFNKLKKTFITNEKKTRN